MNLVVVGLGFGNIGSVILALGRFGVEPVISADPEIIAGADKVILPGVGAAGHAMERIEALGLRLPLRSLKQPALGICLGMQLLFERTDEADVECLGIITGRVRALEAAPSRPVPHMGWSRVDVWADDIGLKSGDYLYFAHGYACDGGPATIASTQYGRNVPAVVRQDNWLAAQFHPERSGEAGASFLKSFLQ